MKLIVKSTRKTADKEIYSKLLTEFSLEFEKIKNKFIPQFNRLRELNPDIGINDVFNEVKRLDELAFTRAEIEDKLNNYYRGYYESPHCKSLRKKILKALGF